MRGKQGQEILSLSCVSMQKTHLSKKHLASFTIVLCCMRSLDPWFACILFLFCFYDFLIFCVIVWFFIPICFICLFPVFGWMHFLCVLSLPVQCWSLSYGKQRRPFRLCAPTWLRQQVWRTFNFFSTWTLFVTAFSLFVREFLLVSDAQHPFKFISYILNFSESEVPSQERKNYKSSPEIQVGDLQAF